MSKRSYWPQNDANTLYFAYENDLQSLLDKIKQEWPDTSLEDISIEAKNIHTECIDYDLHVPSDHTDFIVVSRKS